MVLVLKVERAAYILFGHCPACACTRMTLLESFPMKSVILLYYAVNWKGKQNFRGHASPSADARCS